MKFNSATAKEARRKVRNLHKWTREEARMWANVAVQMRLLNGTSSNQHIKRRSENAR